MADQDGKADAARRGFPLKTVLIVAGVFLLEVATIAVTYFVAGSPPDVTAETTVRNLESWKNEKVEALVVEDKFQNSKRGPTYLYDTQVYVVTSRRFEERVKADLTDMAAQIRMDIATIFRRAEPEHLNEPTFATIKRQIKKALDDRLGLTEEQESMIQNVLITKCIPARIDM